MKSLTLLKNNRKVIDSCLSVWVSQLLQNNLVFFKIVITPNLKSVGIAPWTREKVIKNKSSDILTYAKSISFNHFGTLPFIEVSLQTIVFNKKLNKLEFHHILGFECSTVKINDIKREFVTLDIWETDDYFIESLDSVDQIITSTKSVTSEFCCEAREYPEVILTLFTFKNDTIHDLLIAGFDACGFTEDSGANYTYRTKLITQFK